MPAMKKAKAQKLIPQLESHQQGQIQCLQALFNLAEGGEAMEEVKGMHAYIHFWSSRLLVNFIILFELMSSLE